MGLKIRFGSGVGAGTGHPLPVGRVDGDVAVDQPVQEVRRPAPPVDAELFGQERPDQEPRTVVHPALLAQLAHTGVDDRQARASFGPRGEPRLVLDPVPPSWVQVCPGDGWEAEGRLLVEVPPAHLPSEGRTTLPPRQAVHQLEGREGAEVEVGAEPRGDVAREVVALLAVVGQVGPRPDGHELPAVPSRRGRGPDSARRTRDLTQGGSRPGRLPRAESRFVGRTRRPCGGGWTRPASRA